MSRLKPLPALEHPDLAAAFAAYQRSLGFVPNSVLILQRRPKMVKALAQLAAAVWDPESTVDPGFKRLVSHVASRAHGCQYCMAHTAGGALLLGIDPAKVDAVWNYQTSPLYSLAERVALDFAIAASSVPNAVDDELFDRMREHWSDDDIVEITGVVSLFGFMNRWNDTMATPLEEEALETGRKHLSGHGWAPGKHGLEV
ncbi:MAG: carboxymuconolactone decarboxylase family protein [Pseudomonadota bacterium]|nr:carboxymuconolactone decarboxylase family protein [Pseudomonadota bacterium]